MAAMSHDVTETDMTPMIDVVFQLIIFFVCTIKYKSLEGKLETQLPKDVGVNPTPADILLEKAEIHLNIDKSQPDGFEVLLNGQRMPNLATLSSKLRDLKGQSPDMKATLYPNRGVTYQHVVRVVDACITAELYDITFAGVAFDA